MKLQSFDFFKKLPKDVEASSMTGGIFSVLAILIGVLLFLSEFRYFVTQEVKKEMIIDNDQATTTMRVNFNFTFLRAPCLGLSFDQQDEIGNHKLDVSDTLQKIRVHKNGEIIPRSYGEGNRNYIGSEEEINDWIQGFRDEENCMIVGYIIINKVPGDFHISYHARKDLLTKLMSKGEHQILQNLDMAHKINHLSFGNAIDQKKTEAILKEFKTVQPNFTPYNGLEKIAPGKNNYNSFIKVIPNVFKNEKNISDNVNTFQFSMNSRFSNGDQYGMPNAYYNYEVSPITVVYKVQENSIVHFWVQICAIVGGIFAVMGILNSLTLQTERLIASKKK